MFPVSWAGEDEDSPNWFDTAREFTERWHHQQQIRVAVNKPGIMTRELYFPVLDCFLRALPYSYRNVSAQSGSLAQFDVSGDCGGSWYLFRDGEAWKLIASPAGEKISETTIPQEIAWRIFTKGISFEEAGAQVQVTGDQSCRSSHPQNGFDRGVVSSTASGCGVLRPESEIETPQAEACANHRRLFCFEVISRARADFHSRAIHGHFDLMIARRYPSRSGDSSACIAN